MTEHDFVITCRWRRHELEVPVMPLASRTSSPRTTDRLLVAEMREQRRMFEAFIQNQGPQRQGPQHDAARAATYADFVATR